MASLTLRNIVKRFGTNTVLHGVDLDVAEGEFVALVGPSGCGKSTLLRVLAGLEPLDEGEVLIGARVVNDIAPKNRNLAMVFQNYALYPHMTVAQNLGFSLRLARLPQAEIAQRVQRVAATLGLGNLLARKPGQLSGGQRQRVAMGRAIVREPRAFLFDEPLSNLDAQLRVQVRGEIKALHRRLGVTSVYVTHDQVEAMTLADRIVVMREGRIVQAGSPLALYDRPADAFVARFIGSPAMNLLPGVVDRGAAEAVVVTPDGTRLPVGDAGASRHGQAVLYGVRPEHVRLEIGAGPAEVLHVDPTGAETHVSLRLAGQPIVAALRERVAVRGGEAARVTPLPKQAHLFDAHAGGRLN